MDLLREYRVSLVTKPTRPSQMSSSNSTTMTHESNVILCVQEHVVLTTPVACGRVENEPSAVTANALCGGNRSSRSGPVEYWHEIIVISTLRECVLYIILCINLRLLLAVARAGRRLRMYFTGGDGEGSSSGSGGGGSVLMGAILLRQMLICYIVKTPDGLTDSEI